MSGLSSIQWTGRRLGRMKHVAARLGIALSEYAARVERGEKWCTRCKEWHPVERFGVDHTRYDGRNANCLSQRVTLTHDELRSHRRVTYRRYYAGRGGAGIRARVYARKRSTDPISPSDRESLLEKFGGRCAYCGLPADTIDHVVPVAKGGGSRRGNLLPACISCNSRKRSRDFDDFLSTIPEPDKVLTSLIADELLLACVCS